MIRWTGLDQPARSCYRDGQLDYADLGRVPRIPAPVPRFEVAMAKRGRSRPSEIHFYEWFVSRWIGSSAHDELDACGRGIYREMLDTCYIQGSVTADIEVLSRKCAATASELAARWPTISRNFTADQDGRLHHRMADDFRAEYFQYVDRQKANGRRGGIAKATKALASGGLALAKRSPSGGLAVGVAKSWPLASQEQEQEQELKSSSSSLNRKTSSTDVDGAFELQPSNGTPNAAKPKEQYSEKFLEFWGVVWAKIGKDAAWRQWQSVVKKNGKVSKSEGKDIRDELIAAAREQGPRLLAEAAKGDRTPLHPATWLSQGRWADEEPEAKPIYAERRLGSDTEED